MLHSRACQADNGVRFIAPRAEQIWGLVGGAGEAAAGLLPTLTETLPRWFEGTHHSAFLFVASELVKVFGSNADLQPEIGARPAWLSCVVRCS